MEFKKQHKIGIALAILIIAGAFLFKESPIFSLAIGIGIIIGVLPFVLSTIAETKIAREKEEIFLEFARNLVESVKMGSSISKSVLILKNRNYEVLNKHVGKLANQISMGIPLNIAMQTFSKDINNAKISKAITLIRQAERAGGDIGKILESVAEAVSIADKLKMFYICSLSIIAPVGPLLDIVNRKRKAGAALPTAGTRRRRSRERLH